MNKADRKICEKAVQTFGLLSQHFKACEECGELTRAIARCCTNPGEESWDNLAEEIADVLIMIEQLIIIHNVEAEVKEKINSKLTRLQDRIADKERKRKQEATV